MKQFVARIRWEGNTFEDYIMAYDAASARSILHSKYPGCSIISLNRC